jgi:ferredoxin
MTVKVTIRRGNETQTITARPGLGFQAICAKYKTGIDFDCRASDCGICAIKIISGAEALSPKTAAEEDFLKAMKADPDERLACQTRFLGDVEIAIDYL